MKASLRKRAAAQAAASDEAAKGEAANKKRKPTPSQASKPASNPKDPVDCWNHLHDHEWDKSRFILFFIFLVLEDGANGVVGPADFQKIAELDPMMTVPEAVSDGNAKQESQETLPLAA